MSGELQSRSAVKQLLGTYLFLLVALVVECAVFEIMGRRQGVSSFLSTGVLFSVLDRSAVFGVLSVGMTFVIITGGIDLSVGSVLALGGVVCALVFKMGPEWLWLGLAVGGLVGVVAGAAAGSCAGFVITRFQIPPFIATLALMSSLRGLAYILTGGRSVSGLPEEYSYLGRYAIGGKVPIDVLVMLAIFVAGAVLLNHTRFGRHVKAIGGNEEAARLSGVNVGRVKFLVYAMSGTLAAVGGLVCSSELQSGDPKLGLGAELEVIAAVVVGGTSLSGGRGAIGGTFLGLLVISVLYAGLTWINAETFTQQVVLGLVILAAVLLDRVRRT